MNNYYLNRIDDYLKEVIKDYCCDEKLADSIEYSLFTGGKRLRPLLAIEAHNIFSKEFENILPLACAIELIHTYSLVHDDLPAMDNDDFRRGNPTNHKVYGEDLAILTGDGLLNIAMEVSINAAINSKDPKHYLKAVNYIFKSSGCCGMIGGQVEDMRSNFSDLDHISSMYAKKTGALIKASIVSGAIIGRANQQQLLSLETFAEKLGYFYQIQDDYFDIEEDRKNNKTTAFSFVTENSREYLVNKSMELTDSLDKLEGDTSEFSVLVNSLIKRGY